MALTEQPVEAPRRVVGRAIRTGDDGSSVHLRTCPLCESMCGLEIHLDEDLRVKVIRGDRDDVWSKGYLCPKGTTLGRLHDDPDRLRAPVVRADDGTFREATWAEAFARCQELIAGVVDEHGIAAMTAFIGNPVGHSFSLGRYLGLLVGQARFPVIYSSGTVDQWPKNVSSVLLYGNSWKIPTVDVRRTDHWIIMGGNPQASNGSLLACPDLMGEIAAIRGRGGKVVVIDPRRTGTADEADEWIPIRPGTDAAFLLAVCHVIFADDLVDLGAVDGLVNGIEEVASAVEDFTPESVEAWTTVPAATIRRVAHELAAARRGALYGRIGLCTQEFGTLSSWLVDVVNILSGHFDAEGGLMWGRPAHAPLAWVKDVRGEPEFGRWTSRVRGAPEILGQIPVSCMAEEIDTPGEGQIKGLFTVAGNPVISAPDSARLDAALPLLDCMIAIDNYLNETTRHAHVILPGPSPLETAHFDDLLWGWAAGTATKWSDALFAVPDGTPPEHEILARLGWYCAGGTDDTFDFAVLDDGWFAVFSQIYGLDPEVTARAATQAGLDGGPERMIDLQLRMGPWGEGYGNDADGLTLAAVQHAEHGIDLGPLVPRAADMIGTPSGKIELAPRYILDDLPRLRAALARPPEQLVLVSRRHLRSKNSWMHNVDVLVKGKDRCTLLIHPDDAASTGVADGELARVATAAGSVDVVAEVSDEMMPGVVCLPHGWGHDRPGAQLAVAAKHAGVNNNLLAPGELVDPLSGNAVVNGIPVSVSAAP